MDNANFQPFTDKHGVTGLKRETVKAKCFIMPVCGSCHVPEPESGFYVTYTVFKGFPGSGCYGFQVSNLETAISEGAAMFN